MNKGTFTKLQSVLRETNKQWQSTWELATTLPVLTKGQEKAAIMRLEL